MYSYSTTFPAFSGNTAEPLKRQITNFLKANFQSSHSGISWARAGRSPSGHATRYGPARLVPRVGHALLLLLLLLLLPLCLYYICMYIRLSLCVCLYVYMYVHLSLSLSFSL